MGMSRSSVASELYKDKVEISLDSRQIFYLFFGGSVVVGLVFVLGIVVGRRVEARAHIDRAQTQVAVDPLAALDRLAGGAGLTFQGALRSATPATTSIESSIAQIVKQRGDDHGPANKATNHSERSAPNPVATSGGPDLDSTNQVSSPKPGDKPERHEAATEKLDGPKVAKPAKTESKKSEDKKSEGRKSEVKVEDKKIEDKKVEDKRVEDKKVEDKRVEDKKVEDKKVEDKKVEDKRVEDKKVEDKKRESKSKYALQLSSFQSRGEAEAYLSQIKANGFGAYITEGDVSGKTYYRVRIGNYRSIEAANDAKAELEKSMKKTATVMKL